MKHHLDVIAQAERIIDMGAEGGNGGGSVLFEGTPKQLLNNSISLMADIKKSCHIDDKIETALCSDVEFCRLFLFLNWYYECMFTLSHPKHSEIQRCCRK